MPRSVQGKMLGAVKQMPLVVPLETVQHGRWLAVLIIEVCIM